MTESKLGDMSRPRNQGNHFLALSVGPFFRVFFISDIVIRHVLRTGMGDDVEVQVLSGSEYAPESKLKP